MQFRDGPAAVTRRTVDKPTVGQFLNAIARGAAPLKRTAPAARRRVATEPGSQKTYHRTGGMWLLRGTGRVRRRIRRLPCAHALVGCAACAAHCRECVSAQRTSTGRQGVGRWSEGVRMRANAAATARRRAAASRWSSCWSSSRSSARWSRCCCPPCRRPARRRGARSARTICGRSAGAGRGMRRRAASFPSAAWAACRRRRPTRRAVRPFIFVERRSCCRISSRRELRRRYDFATPSDEEPNRSAGRDGARRASSAPARPTRRS